MSRRLVALVLVACSHSTPQQSGHVADHSPHTITIIGTNDLHGALDRLPLLAGFVANVRAARAADGGGVLLLDGGDLFQGTLESNLAEGADVVRAYNQLHYDASAIGNHEFDYGPVGPPVTAKAPGDDPRGALKKNIADAKFQFLSANITDDATGKPIAWPNLRASTTIEVAGVKVGIVGVSTKATPTTTMPANFKGLHMTASAQAVAAEAKALRANGADIIVVVAHIGSECKDIHHHDDVSSCDKRAELFELVEALPKGAVDAIVAGHTHNQVAHSIDGVAVIESWSSGRAFGRIDFQVADHKIVATTIHEPQMMCPLDENHDPVAVDKCRPDDYEGRPVIADPAVKQIVADAIARAGNKRDEKLGVTLTGTITKAYLTESALGNFFTDLMLAAHPEAQIALTNGGGLRASLPAGELTYGQLFQSMPFDNRFALVDVDGATVKTLVIGNLKRGAGIFSWGGLVTTAKCDGKNLDVQIAIAGKPLEESARYKLVTSDFLASGGDGALKKLPPSSMVFTDEIIRESIADVLRARKGTIDPKQLVTPKRLSYPGRRPVKCSGGGSGGGDDE
jgi:5'-nucleotidase